jgi:hypothetical protein
MLADKAIFSSILPEALSRQFACFIYVFDPEHLLFGFDY